MGSSSLLKNGDRWRQVRDLAIDEPSLLQVQVLRAKCRNSACPLQSFTLPSPVVAPAQRVSRRGQEEAGGGMVTDNVPFRREAPRLGRAFHLPTTAATLQRWVRKMAAAASMPDILARLEFSRHAVPG